MADKPKTVKVTVARDYWAGKDEVFIGSNAAPEGERIPAGMEVDIFEKRAFALANDEIVKLVIPKE